MGTSLVRCGCFVLVFHLLLASMPAHAEAIRGRIRTEQDESISRVAVDLSPKSDRGSQQRVLSDADGRYAFENVAPGSYRLQFTKRYWQPAKRHITVLDGEDRDINVTMALTLLFETLVKIQLLSFAYGVMFGVAILWLNFYMVPKPTRVLTGLGWGVMFVSMVIGAFKLAPEHTIMLAIAGVACGGFTQWRGNRLAAGRRVEIDRENRRRNATRKQTRQEVESLVGKHGIALTQLKACGIAEVDGRSIEVRAATGFIDKGTPIIVRELDGFMPVVAVSSESTQQCA